MRCVLLALALVSCFASSAFAQWPYSRPRHSAHRSPYRTDATFSQTPYGYSMSSTSHTPFGSTTLNFGVQPRQQRYINHSYGGYVNPYGSGYGYGGFKPNPWYGGFGAAY